MNARSVISSPPMSPATDNFTPSVASESGPVPCEMLDSPTMSTCGPAAVRARRSRRQDESLASPTIGTSGPSGFDSSRPVDLLLSLENRFRARTASLGSTLFELIWKMRTTPSGYSISQLHAWARRTRDTASTSWPTPVKEDARSSARHGYMIEGNAGTTLLDAARLTAEMPAPYPTPQAHDHKPPKTPEQIEAMRARAPKRPNGGPPGISNLNEVVLQMVPEQSKAGPASWATPVATELGNTVENYLAMKRNMKSGPRTAITHPSLQAKLTAPEIASASSEIPPGEDLSEALQAAEEKR
jgi:hypothetical protein